MSKLTSLLPAGGAFLFGLIFCLSLTSNIDGASCKSLLLQPQKLKLFAQDEPGSHSSGSESNSPIAEFSVSGGVIKERKSVVSFCPAKCSCNVTLTNQLQVMMDAFVLEHTPDHAVSSGHLHGTL